MGLVAAGHLSSTVAWRCLRGRQGAGALGVCGRSLGVHHVQFRMGLMLQVLNLLLQIPIDILFQTQIPLTITYCPESSIYIRWCPEQGGVSPLHKEVRASCMLSKVLGGVTCQPSEGVDHPPSLAPSDSSAGSGGLWGSRHRSHSHALSITPAHSR